MAKLDESMIKEARKATGMSQAALAEAAGCVTASDISKAERGLKELTPEQLDAIAKVLGVADEPAASETLTDAEKELLGLFRAADAETQNSATTVLKGEVPQNPGFMEKLGGMLGAAGGSEDPMAALMGMLGGEGGEKVVSALMGMLSKAAEKKDAKEE